MNMKKNFFTLLALLAMVCSSVDAQTTEETEETEEVTISATVGARTYVSSHDLNFKKFNKNAAENGGVYDLNLTPYYISDYNVTDGEFILTRFKNDQVPANTPMILLGKQYNAGDEKSFDVPIKKMATPDVNKAKYSVWNNNYAWLVPVMKTAYLRKITLQDEHGNEADETSEVVFFNNTGITEGERLALNQTEDVQVGVTRDTTYTYLYYEMTELASTYRKLLNNKEPLYENDWEYENDDEEMVSVTGIGISGTEGEIRIFWAAKKNGTAPVFRKYTYMKKYGSYCWYPGKEVDESDNDYEPNANPDLIGRWKRDSVMNVSTDAITETYTQYFLGVGTDKKTPVFKKCNSNGTNGVKYGGAYVRVWSALLGGVSAAREDMSFELFDEDGTEITYQNDEVTGIRSLQNTIDAKKENRQVYNLQGQKLDKMKPGLNIVNGKKYFVK